MDAWRCGVVGAGAIGRTIATWLREANGYEPLCLDRDERALAWLEERGVATRRLDLADEAALAAALGPCDAVISAAPFHLTAAVARAARQARVHYLDLTEDVAATAEVKALASGAETAFAPQCGLAPGYVGMIGAALAAEFERIDRLTLRVGALPRFPTNALKYNLSWSTQGLINEYCNPCEALVDGELVRLAPLDGRETFAIDGIEYEAFDTSGGLGDLARALRGKARNLSYKTIRYPGHRDLIRFLLHDLGLIDRRDLLRELLEGALPRASQDVVIVFCTAIGAREGVLEERSRIARIEARTIGGEAWSAIQIATAAGALGVLDLLRSGALANAGFVRQEDAPLDAFHATPFGARIAR